MRTKYTRTNVHGLSLTLKPYTLDDGAKAYFTQGQCHSLAYELHKKLNLPMIWLECPWWDQIVHCAVMFPDGTFLDINGISEPEVFGYLVHAVRSPDAFINSCTVLDEDDLTWMEPDVELADHFADLVISEYALDIAESMSKCYT